MTEEPRAFRCRIVRATTVAELDTVGSLRWTVFSEAIGFGLELAPAMREITAFDTRPEANHFIAYVDGEAIGTIRLMLPSASLAERHGCRIGLPLAIAAPFGQVPSGCVVAELGRSAVCHRYRGSPAVGHLMRAAYLMSRSAGVTHWAAASLTGTDDPIDASIIDRLSRVRDQAAVIEIRGPDAPPRDYVPRRSLFDAPQRLLAARGDLSALSLPRTLRFHMMCGARISGLPYFDQAFREFLVPLVFDLADYATSPFGHRYCGGTSEDAIRHVPHRADNPCSDLTAEVAQSSHEAEKRLDARLAVAPQSEGRFVNPLSIVELD